MHKRTYGSTIEAHPPHHTLLQTTFLLFILEYYLEFAILYGKYTYLDVTLQNDDIITKCKQVNMLVSRRQSLSLNEWNSWMM